MAEKKDKIEFLNERLKDISETLQVFKEHGIDEELLEAWLCYKLKTTKRHAHEIINCYNEFFSRLLKNAIVEKL
jgi:hypothetical protein